MGKSIYNLKSIFKLVSPVPVYFFPRLLGHLSDRHSRRSWLARQLCRGPAGPNNIQLHAFKTSLERRERIPVVSALAPLLPYLRHGFHLLSWIGLVGFVV